MLTFYLFFGLSIMFVCESRRQDGATPENPYPVQTGEDIFKKLLFWPLYYPFPLKNPAADSTDNEE